MVIYLSRQAYLDFSGSYVSVFCDGGMLAELSLGSHVRKGPNLSVNANSKEDRKWVHKGYCGHKSM